ncbi:YfhO family protein [Luteibacter sp. UNC138MFCol5.1]|uniref:YfhO family protein n=1 Tax=Luteibacter sp. UNC138MFCol5.1 TaxID=1502774 RepID=UPI000B7EB509|nr:YfhO family protein [Luteibacter sp. UNC138MFCol5.1]
MLANGVGGELLLVTLFFAAFFALYFSPVWSTDSLLAPGDAAISYFPFFHEPWTLISDRLLLGFPVEADLQVQANYPLKLLLPSYNSFVISAYVLMAVGTYAFLSAYTESRVGALIAAIVSSSGGFMIAHLGHATIIHAACWIPWIFWAFYCGSERLNWPAVCVGAVAVCMSLLGGHPQISIIGFGVGGVFWIFLCGLARAQGRPIKGVLIHGACVFILGLMLSSISTVPFAELAAQGVRAGWSIADYDSYSNSVRTLLIGFFPGLFGTVPAAFYGPYVGPYNLTELAFYAGVVPMVLAGVGLLACRRNPHVWFWAAIAVVAILLSMGASTPLGKLVYHMPVVGTFRAQGRYGFVFILAIATMLAFSVGAFRNRSVRHWHVVIPILVLVCVAVLSLRLISHIYPVLGAHPWDIMGDTFSSMVRNPAIFIPIALMVSACVLTLLWVSSGKGALSVITGLLVAVDLASFGMFFEWRYEGLTPTMRTPSAATLAQVNAVRASGTRVLPVEESRLVYGPFSPQVNVAFGVPLAVNYGPMLPARAQRFARLDPTGHPHFDIATSPLPDIMGVGWFARSGGGLMFDDVVLSRGCGAPATPKSVEYAVPPGTRAAQIRIVSHLACSTGVEQGEQVATVQWSGPDGAASDLALRAGIDTSEWAIDRPGLKVNHQRAPVAMTFDAPGAPGHDYVTNLVLQGGAEAGVSSLRLDLAGQGDLAMRARSVELVDTQRHALKLSPSKPGLTVDVSNPAVSLARRNAQPPLQWSVCRTSTMGKGEIDAVLSGKALPDGSTFDPHAVALLEPRHAPPAPDCSVAPRLSNIERRPGWFRASVDGAGSSLLVVSQAWYPGWTARVDGRKTRVLPVDGLIQGVFVPSGKHEVELAFLPVSFIVGCVLSLLAIVLLLTPFVRERLRLKKKFSGDR